MRAFGVVDLPSRLRARVVLQELAKSPYENVFDFGCGTGCYSFYVARQPEIRVSGLDSNEARVHDCIAIAHKIGRKNMTFFVRSGHDGLRRFISRGFDSVLAIEVLQYVPDPLLTLRQICRLLIPGGRIIGHVPVLGYLREHEKTLFDDLNLSAMLRESGFEDVSITRTFGDGVRRVCEIFECVSHSRLLTAVAFPFLLMASAMCRIPSPRGDYRLFVARKPFNAAQAIVDRPDSSSSA